MNISRNKKVVHQERGKKMKKFEMPTETGSIEKDICDISVFMKIECGQTISGMTQESYIHMKQ